MTGTLTRTHARASTHTDACTHARGARHNCVSSSQNMMGEWEVCDPHYVGRWLTCQTACSHTAVCFVLFIAIVRGVYCTNVIGNEHV